jgi:hypothetical protein
MVFHHTVQGLTGLKSEVAQNLLEKMSDKIFQKRVLLGITLE